MIVTRCEVADATGVVLRRQSTAHRRRSRLPVTAVGLTFLAATLAACSSSGESESGSVEDLAAVGPVVLGNAAPPSEALAPVSEPYLSQLCSFDTQRLFAVENPEDPLASVAEAFAEIQTDDPTELAELAALTAAFEQSRGSDDIEQLVAATAIIRARCSGLVIR